MILEGGMKKSSKNEEWAANGYLFKKKSIKGKYRKIDADEINAKIDLLLEVEMRKVYEYLYGNEEVPVDIKRFAD